jgi:hypothetical protein
MVSVPEWLAIENSGLLIVLFAGLNPISAPNALVTFPRRDFTVV